MRNRPHPAVTIADLMRQGRRADLVGRRRELRVLEGMLREGGPALAYIHGPPGIGKTALVAAFEAGLDEVDVTHARIEAGAVEPRPEAILAALASRLGVDACDLSGFCRAMADRKRTTVLTIDNVDTWRLAATWLRLELVPRLPASMRLVLVGSSPPPPVWSVEFGNLFLDLKLGPLDRTDVEAMVARMGIDGGTAGRIWETYGGHPLAVRLALHAVRAGTPTTAHDVGAVANAILHAIGDDELSRATEACAVVRRGSRALISRIIGADEPIRAELMDRLEALPFANRVAEGVYLAEPVRRAIVDRMSGLEPERYAAWRKAAADWTTDRLRASGPSDRWRHMADLLHLLDQPILRNAFFPPDEPAPPVEPARREDFPALLHLTEARCGTAERARVQAWAERLPHRFSVVRSMPGEIAGYYVYGRADDPLEGLAEADPLFADWAAHLAANPAQGEVLFVRQMLAVLPGRDVPARIACNLDLKRNYLERWGLSRVYTCATDDELASPLFYNLGFRVVAGPRGDLPGTMVLDLPGADLIGWVSALVGAAERPQLRSQCGFALVRDRREVRFGGETITLIRLECEVLSALIDRAPAVVGREELIESVWRRPFVGSNVVDTVIRTLRKKLGSMRDCIQTVPKAGYRFRAPEGRAVR